MAIPPLAVELSAEELGKYYTRILQAVTIPVILQDASGYLGHSLPVETQLRLFEEFSDRVLFKPEAKPVGSMISQLRAATLGRAEIFDGSAGVSLVDNYRRGVVGTMPGADVAKAIVGLWRALEVGDEPRTAKLAGLVTALASLQTSLDAYLAVEKHLLVKQGIFRNAVVRGPIGWVFDEATRGEVDRLFDELMKAIAGLC
jgi:4-hydroxy-tetrahydrodipicolinate synthase